MKALWLQGGAVALRDLPDPEPRAGNAIVRVHLAGICGTDLQLVGGYAGFEGIPGHEMVGTVESAPDAPEWIGRRVVAEINVGCAACPECAAGRRTHCAQRTVIGIRARPGVFAERVAVPIGNLHAVPDGVINEQAVFAEPLAAAYRVTELVPVGPAERVLVLGDGRLGQLVARVVHGTGAQTTVVGRHEEKLDRLRRLGIDARTAPERGVRYDVVVECTGRAEGIATAARLVRPLGSIVLKTTCHGAHPVDLAPIVVDEVRVVGSRCGPFPTAIRALAERAVTVTDLVDACLPLDRGAEALAAAATRLKVLLRP